MIYIIKLLTVWVIIIYDDGLYLKMSKWALGVNPITLLLLLYDEDLCPRSKW